MCVCEGGVQCVCVVGEGGSPCWDNQVCACGGVGVGVGQDKYFVLVTRVHNHC